MSIFVANKSMIIKCKYEYLIVFIAVCWALFFSFVLQLKPYFSPLGDDATYLYSAQILYSYGIVDNTRPIVISAIFGFPYFFGYSSFVVIKWGFFLNFLSWIGTALLVFKTLSFQFTRKTAFIGALLFVFCIGNLAHAFRFLTESIFVFLLTISIYLLQLYFSLNKPKYVVIAVAILLFSALIKPVSLMLAVVVGVYFIRKTKEFIYNKFFSLIIVALLLLAYQVTAIKQRYGDYTISYIGAITYYNYLGCKAYCYANNIDYLPGKNQRTKDFNKMSSHKMKQIANEDFKYQVRNNFTNLCKAYLFCIYSNSSKGNYIVSECKNKSNTFYFDFFRFLFKAVSKLQTIFFTILGIFLSVFYILKYKKKLSFYVVISLMLLTIFFISAISCFECDRFHITFFPIVILQTIHLIKQKFVEPLQK